MESLSIKMNDYLLDRHKGGGYFLCRGNNSYTRNDGQILGMEKEDTHVMLGNHSDAIEVVPGVMSLKIKNTE